MRVRFVGFWVHLVAKAGGIGCFYAHCSIWEGSVYSYEIDWSAGIGLPMQEFADMFMCVGSKKMESEYSGPGDGRGINSTICELPKL